MNQRNLKDVEFISIKDAAKKLRISAATLKARIIQGRYLALVHVCEQWACGTHEEFLPPHDCKTFPWTRWKDHGSPIFESGGNFAQPDRRPRYELDGWVIYDSVAQVLTDGASFMGAKWLGVPSFGEDTTPVYVAANGDNRFNNGRRVTEEDIYLPDMLLPQGDDGFPLPSVKKSKRITVSESKVRPQREQNLLRVIEGLWMLSSLPRAPNVTADKLSALFDTWGWDGPGKSTMADTILKPASQLPKAKS